MMMRPFRKKAVSLFYPFFAVGTFFVFVAITAIHAFYSITNENRKLSSASLAVSPRKLVVDAAKPQAPRDAGTWGTIFPDGVCS